MIRLSGVSKVYKVAGDGGAKRDFYALKDVSLEVQEGSIYGIIGRSGAGKSTLIRCINLLERPTAGQVFVGDTEMTALAGADLRKARRKIGMIFQNFSLLANRTVYKNIAFPLELAGWSKGDIDERVHEIASLVDIEGRLGHYPSQLSGGQKQRVGIARALANRPDVLLSDEATSALDPQTTTSVLRLMRDINEKLGLTIVLITHEMNVIKEICHSVAVIDAGEVVEEGSVRKVFTSPVKNITKDLLTRVIRAELPESFAKGQISKEPIEGGGLLMQISFFGSIATDPIVSSISRKFDVDLNILAAQIDHIRSDPYGTMIIELTGDERDEALEYMMDMDLKLEVIGYVARSGEPAAAGDA